MVARRLEEFVDAVGVAHPNDYLPVLTKLVHEGGVDMVPGHYHEMGNVGTAVQGFHSTHNQMAVAGVSWDTPECEDLDGLDAQLLDGLALAFLAGIAPVRVGAGDSESRDSYLRQRLFVNFSEREPEIAIALGQVLEVVKDGCVDRHRFPYVRAGRSI
jgi:hypothetical protein